MHRLSLIQRLAQGITNLFFFWRKRPGPRDARRGPGAGAAEPAGPTRKAALEAHLRALLSDKAVITAGGLQILGLDKIRGRFGEGWAAVSNKVHAIAQAAIRRRLSAADVFTRIGDQAYVIVFGELTKEEAQVRCAQIAEEIWDRLLVDGVTVEDLEVKTVAVDVEGRMLLEKVDLVDALDLLLENAYAGGAGSVLKREWWTSAGEADDLAKDAHAPPRDLDFLYRPMWDVHRGALLYFVCTPVHGTGSGDVATGYDVLDVSSDVVASADLDMLMLRRVIRDLQLLHHKGARLPVTARVRFDTLANPKTRGSYLDLCRAIPEPLRSYVTFDIVGLPETVPQALSADLLSALRQVSRNIHVELEPNHTAFERFRSVGIHAVGLDMGATPCSERRLMSMMDAFAVRGKRAGFRTFVHGVDSTSLAMGAVCAGYDYIGGEAIHPLTHAPDRACQFQPENLFSHLLAHAP